MSFMHNKLCNPIRIGKHYKLLIKNKIDFIVANFSTTVERHLFLSKVPDRLPSLADNYIDGDLLPKLDPVSSRAFHCLYS